MAISAGSPAQPSPRPIAGLELVARIALVAAALVVQARPGTAWHGLRDGHVPALRPTMLMQQVRAAP
jgi:hypothetical protein